MSENTLRITTPQSLNAYIKNICDVMRHSGRLVVEGRLQKAAYLEAV